MRNQKPSGMMPVKNISLVIRADVHAVNKNFPVFDIAERIFEIEIAQSDAFNLRPGKRNPRLKTLQDKVVMKGLPV